MAGKRGHRGFGLLRRLPSKRWQASYVGPDTLRHNAPSTFVAKIDGEAWLAAESRMIERGTWMAPADRGSPAVAALTFGAYAATWLAGRTLKPRTRELYGSLLARRILPTLAPVALTAITPSLVRRWYADQGSTAPTATSHAYGLLKAILATAVADEHLAANPCRVRGAGSSRRVHKIRPATLTELDQLVAAMPDHYRLLILLAAWTGLRFGELTELRRGDVDIDNGVLRVRRAVAHVAGVGPVVGSPKSDAGVRDVFVPPHLGPLVREHLRSQIRGGRNGLLFPAADGTSHLAPSSLYRRWRPARIAAGRPDLRFHDLRHTGAVLAASTGASLSELMTRLGHSTPAAALQYQHTAGGRDRQIAEALSVLAGDAK